MNGSGYTIVQAGAEVPAEEFVRRYVDLKDPTAGCRPCPDYGRYWTCPPYDVPAAEYWGRYETVLLRGMQFHFTRQLLGPEGVALRQRPDTGLLAGLWEYPHVPGRLTEEQAAQQLRTWGLTPGTCSPTSAGT